MSSRPTLVSSRCGRSYQVSVTSKDNTIERLRRAGYTVSVLDEKMAMISMTEDELETALASNQKENAKTILIQLNTLVGELDAEISKVKEQDFTTVVASAPKEEINISDDFQENAKNLSTTNLDKRYTTEEDMAAIDSIASQADELFAQAEKQKEAANTITDDQERANALNDAAKLEKAAKEKQETGIVQYNFRVNQEQLIQEGFQDHLMGSDELTNIRNLKTEK